MGYCCENNVLSWVKGNDVLLMARVYEKVLDEGEATDLPFDLSACDDIAVTATNDYKTEVLEWAVAQDEDNCLVLRIPHTLEVCSNWMLEVTCTRDGYHVRSFEVTFAIVETNCEARTTFDVVDGCQSASLRVTLQIVPQAEERGKNAYELWKELPGNEDKTLQDYIDEVLDMNGITAAAREATDAANTAAASAASTEADCAAAVSAANAAATGANDAATLANTKAAIADEKATLADEKATLANSKAGLADSAATLASQKAALADEKATEAARVNAVLSQSEGAVILTVTNRNGISTAKEVGFRIAKTYVSISAMNADAANVDEGRFVLIASTVEDADNAKLYVKNGQGGFTYLTDLSGATGLKGDDGKSATVTVGTVTGGATAAVTNSGTQYDAVLNFVLPKGDDGVGIVSITYKNTDSQGGKVYTILLDNGNSYDITCPKGDASTADINLNGSVISVTNNAGVTNTIDVLASTDERVQIAVTSSVQGVSVAGLTISAYYNNASVPTATCTTDANGMAVLSVPNGYKYRLVFPSIQGCAEPNDVVHTASVSQRSVEVEYKEYVISDGEIVRVVVEQKSADVLSRVANVQITVAYDGTSTQYTTDSTGTVQFIVPYGKQYTITAPQRQDWYLHENRYTLNLTAEQTNRAVTFVYRSYESGLTIIASDGSEFTLGEWEAAVEAETRQNSEAMLIKISTGQLAQKGGVFAIDIDMVRGRAQGSNRAWSSQNVQFNSVPLNGNSTSAAYYYDGLTASRLVQQEGDERSIDTLAADQCLAMSRTIAAGTESELTLPGFLGSVGQWNELWKNVAEIDDILLSTRPNGTYLMSTWTTSKWTITQGNAVSAWYWGTAASGTSKISSFVVLPFFAY